jgi:type 9 secretion system plug protein
MKPHITILLLLFTHISYSQGKGDIEYRDKVYDDFIKTVQLYPANGQISSQTQSPVIGLRSGQKLLLEFDELFNEAFTYRAKIIHCNANWQPSGLSPLQYLKEYNEFDIRDFEYSFGTITPYVHYKFILPKTTITGNFILVVYGDDEEDIIITKRFMVYEQLVNFSPPSEIMRNAPYSRTNQQLQFEVKYGSIELLNPMEYVSVNILQNQRWDNAKMNLKPTSVREIQQTLEYRQFTNENSFPAGNEFRYFDIRSLQYFGFHVSTVKFDKDKSFAWVETDKPRAFLAYSIERNLNGRFLIENLERKIPTIENDYALVYFKLESPQLTEDVYLSGKFTNWQKNGATLMKYNATKGAYLGSYVLKQGLYDYQYVMASAKRENDIEGNFRETNDIYEIFVYYNSQKLNADILIGYHTFVFNLSR